MKNSLIPIVTAAIFVAWSPSALAYTFSNDDVRPLYGPEYRRVFRGPTTVAAPLNDNSYVGIPYMGVDRLSVNEYNHLLADLEQRVINLKRARKKPGVSPLYGTKQRVYERLLRRVGDDKITHYRTEAEPRYRQQWLNGKLVYLPVLTPDGIEALVDQYEYVRAVRTSPDDYCKKYFGRREAMCRATQLVNDKIHN